MFIGIGIGITAGVGMGVGRASGPQWAIDYDASRSAGPLLQLPAGTTFTRASAALAIDHNGVPWIAKSGEIVEWGKRRVDNLFASSATLSTQSVTVPSGATVLVSFHGTGSIAFSGGASGSLAGTGVSDRVHASKTASTTSITCTVSGSVTDAQFEIAYPGQTEPSEYISTGVLSAPYHGWGADGVKYFNTDESGDPISAATMRGIIVAPQATNVIRSASDLTRSPWHIEGAADSSLSFDPVMGGQYTQLRDVGAKFVDDVWLATGGLSGSTRYEPCFVIRAISSSGTLQLVDTQWGATGQWSIDLSAVGAGDLINRDHPAVTIDNEFVSVVSGNMGLTFAAAAGSLDFDVSLITLIEGTTPAPTPIPNASTSAAATRNADSLVVNVPDGSYSISTTYGDGSTEAVSDTASSGLTLTSADFSKATVKKMQGNPA